MRVRWITTSLGTGYLVPLGTKVSIYGFRVSSTLACRALFFSGGTDSTGTLINYIQTDNVNDYAQDDLGGSKNYIEANGCYVLSSNAFDTCHISILVQDLAGIT